MAQVVAQELKGLLAKLISELFGHELAGLHLAFVQFRVLLPLLRQIVEDENCGHRANRNAGATIDAFHGINVELGNALEWWAAVVIGRVLLGVDAIYGTGVNAGGVFRSDAGFGNDIGHLPLARIYAMPVRRRFNRMRVQAAPLKIASTVMPHSSRSHSGM